MKAPARRWNKRATALSFPSRQAASSYQWPPSHRPARRVRTEKAAPPPAPPAKLSPITTHVLNTTRGRPAENLPITLVGRGRHCSPRHLTYFGPSQHLPGPRCSAAPLFAARRSAVSLTRRAAASASASSSLARAAAATVRCLLS